MQWAGQAGEDRTPAYSLVNLTQELSILSGPVLLAALTALASASLALGVLAGLAGAGALCFALASEPARTGERTVDVPRAVLRSRSMRSLLLVALLVGGALGGLEVAVPTLATAYRTPAAAGVLLALISVGGILGATIYGSRPWQARPATRLLWLLGCLMVALTVLPATQGLWVAGALLLLAGVALNPAITTFSLLVDQHVPAGAAGEAFGWLSTALAGGTGAASALAAALAQHRHDARMAFLVAAVAGLCAVAVALLPRGADAA